MKNVMFSTENKSKKDKGKRTRSVLLCFLFTLAFSLFVCSKSLLFPLSLSAQTPDPHSPTTEQPAEPTLQPFEKVTQNTKKLPGLFTLYRNKEGDKIYLEIKPEQLQQKFLCFVTLESGLGESGVFSGLPVGDFLFQFRRLNNKVEFVVPNVYFRTRPDAPQARSVRNSFSESVLYSLPIKSIEATRKTILVDLSDLLLSEHRDLPGIAAILPMLLGGSYTLDAEKSYFKEAKAFPLNVEVSTIYSFSGSNDGTLAYLPTLPDSRAFNLRIHYSISEVPAKNGYRPRIADERVGYFLTAYKDFSEENQPEPFVRFINRWHLEKQNPSAPLSPPVKPLVFWLENTIPLAYREAIKEGILLWNKAFEKAGFIDAIQVKQMPDNASWDPADVRYNTIRWSSSFEPWFAGIGPSRVNPLTGEILDADILLDANIVRDIKRGYRVLVEQNQATNKAFPGQNNTTHNPCQFGTYSRYLQALGSDADTLLGGPATSYPDDLPLLMERYQQQSRSSLLKLMASSDLCFGLESTKQFAVGTMAISLLGNVPANSATPSKESIIDELIKQYLRFLTAHEVGHTLGLRHNFHGSTMLSPEDLNNTEITRSKGMVASVMDYVPVNLAPAGKSQGDYFSQEIGPYDEWAIEYGYKPVGGLSGNSELSALEEIAQRSPEPQLSYAPDEDALDILDPAANVFDLSSDMLHYSEWQLDNAHAIWQRLEGSMTAFTGGYSELRAMFDTVFSYYFQNAMNATLYVGGQSFNRDRPNDPNGRLPFEPIPAPKQREALALLQKYVFDADAFNFSPTLLNKLAPSRWDHWGSPALLFPLDYPIGDRITFFQRFVLRVLLSPVRLARLRDAELKTQPENVLKMPELFETLQKGIWTEVIEPEDKLVQISNFRRSLQREHLAILTGMVLRKAGAPEDARALAWSQLRELREAMSKTLRGRGNKLDAYTKAHLEEARDRITKTLNAQLQSN